VTDREKMEGYCSTGQSPQRAVVPVEEEEEELNLTWFFQIHNVHLDINRVFLFIHQLMHK
jgi:hypothetical protein